MFGNILDEYVAEVPDPRNGLNIFAGEWSSNIPGAGLGTAGLFDDARISWLEERAGGFRGKRIMELGPLEGGHTWMMEQAGAKEILAIESNTRAYMKCLLVKEFLSLNAKFLLGDFRGYLDATTNRFDFILASGVLYHMTDPFSLLKSMASKADSFGIWTHYYDEAVISRLPVADRFSGDLKETESNGVSIWTKTQNYGDVLNNKAFTGGSAQTSEWLTLDSLVGALESLGLKLDLQKPELNHPHGPCILLYAHR